MLGSTTSVPTIRQSRARKEAVGRESERVATQPLPHGRGSDRGDGGAIGLGHLLSLLILASMGVALTGCEAGGRRQPEPQPGESFDASKIQTRDDITQVNSFYVAPPWLRDEGRIVGFRARAYFSSAETGRGAFVPGTIIVTLERRAKDPEGKIVRVPVHEWKLNEKEAMGFRMTRRVGMGYSYGLILRWPDDLNLMGQAIEITIKYERTDGVMIPSPPKQFRVE